MLIGTVSISLLSLLGTWGPLFAKRMGWISMDRERPLTTTKISVHELLPVAQQEEPPVDLEEFPEVEPPAVETHEFLVPEPAPEDQADATQSMSTVEQLAEAPNFGAENIECEAMTEQQHPASGLVVKPEVLYSVVSPFC